MIKILTTGIILVLTGSICLAQYCEPVHQQFVGSYITNVKIGAIDNSSEQEHWADNTDLTADIGEATPISITTEGGALDSLGLFIDWDQNFNFSDEGDTVTRWAGPGEHTALITPPLGKPEGKTMMRLRVLHQEISPCNLPKYVGGDTEDYTVNVTWSKPTPLRMVYPNGGEGFNIGQTYELKWVTADYITIDNVNLKYQADFGEWQTIASGITNEGQYDWEIPDIPSWSIHIEVSSASGPESDRTDEVFQITPLAVLEPVKGATLDRGSTYTIKWTVSTSITVVKIQYKTGTGNWTDIADQLDNTGSYEWQVPNLASDSVQIRIMSPITGAMAVSDSLFSIAGELNTGRLSRRNGIALYNGTDKLVETSQGNFTAINIRNIHGRLIASIPVTAKKVFWNGLDFENNAAPRGIYFFKFSGNGISVRKKGIVK